MDNFGKDYPLDFGFTRQQTIQNDPLRFYTFVVKSLLQEHEPEKVRLLDKLLAKYRGREDHLVQKLSVRYNKEEEEEEEPHIETYCYEGGIKEYVAYMCREKETLHKDIIYVSGEKNGINIEVAFQWCIDAYSDNILGFANNIRTIDGGTHLEGLKAVLTRTLNNVARKRNKIKENEPNLAGENVREGLTAVISVKVPEPEFEGQTKTKLGNTEVRGIVDSLVGETLNEYLEQNPQVADTIIEKAVQAYKAAEGKTCRRGGSACWRER